MYIYIYIYGDPANVRPAEVRNSHFCRFCKKLYIYIYKIFANLSELKQAKMRPYN